MLRIKKLDIFIVKSYFLLFIGTFFICLFIFMMQFLWRYVDELIGKGLELSILAKFFYYSSLSLVATSLPLAILLASLITFGNFGERFELLAMKAAGIPLLHVMRPLIILTFLMSCASFYFQNVVTPASQVKLYTLLISMKQKSPELEIPEGVFYDQIDGYNVYVKRKDPKTGMLYNIMIYNFSEGFDNAHIIVADSGKLDMTEDKQHLKLHLYNGEQFENLRSQTGASIKNVPYRRESFIDKMMLIQFDAGFNMASNEYFQKDARSKNMAELSFGADSIQTAMDSIGRVNYKEAKRTTFNNYISRTDSLKIAEEHLTALNLDSAINKLSRKEHDQLYRDATHKIQSQYSDLMFKCSIAEDGYRNIRRHHIEWINKIVLSLACMIFFFIGAPLGAIIRKGGLGLPVIISVLIFIFYYIIDNTGYKMARNGTWPVWFGRWLSTMVLAPLGAFITYKANSDSVLFNADAYMEAIRKVLGLRVSRNLFRKEVIIEDPDYSNIVLKLDSLSSQCQEYADKHHFARIPNYYKIFTNEKDDQIMTGISRELEEIINECANSKSYKIIGLLNQYPHLMVNAHKSPFSSRGLNMACGLFIPAGLFFFFRIWRFSRRLDGDLKTIVKNSSDLKRVIQKEYLSPDQA